jgi:hypothetical protein
MHLQGSFPRLWPQDLQHFGRYRPRIAHLPPCEVLHPEPDCTELTSVALSGSSSVEALPKRVSTATPPKTCRCPRLELDPPAALAELPILPETPGLGESALPLPLSWPDGFRGAVGAMATRSSSSSGSTLSVTSGTSYAD